MNTKLIGITGGIGSGKSTVSNILNHLGYKVYNSDIRAQELLFESNDLKNRLIQLIGPKVLVKEKINKKILSDIIFNNKSILKKINSIIHPEVIKDFKSWVGKHSNEKILFKESALLFESGTYKDLDSIILVIAQKKIRIKRILQRDTYRTEDQILSIIKNQVSPSSVIEFCDFILENDEKELFLPKVISLLDEIKIKFSL